MLKTKFSKVLGALTAVAIALSAMAFSVCAEYRTIDALTQSNFSSLYTYDLQTETYSHSMLVKEERTEWNGAFGNGFAGAWTITAPESGKYEFYPSVNNYMGFTGDLNFILYIDGTEYIYNGVSNWDGRVITNLISGTHEVIILPAKACDYNGGYGINNIYIQYEATSSEPEKVEIISAKKTQDAEWAKLNTMYWGVKINGGGTDRATLQLKDSDNNYAAWEEKDISAFSGSGDIIFGIALSNPEGDKLDRKMILNVSAYIYDEGKTYSAESTPISYNELD